MTQAPQPSAYQPQDYQYSQAAGSRLASVAERARRLTRSWP